MTKHNKIPSDWQDDPMAVINQYGHVEYIRVDNAEDATLVGLNWNVIAKFAGVEHHGIYDGELAQFEGVSIKEKDYEMPGLLVFEDGTVEHVTVNLPGRHIPLISDEDTINELLAEGEIGGEGYGEFYVYEP